MSKRRKQKDEKKEEKQQEENALEELGIKKWIVKTTLMVFFLIALVLMVQFFFDVKILTDSLIAISIVVPLGFLHEGLHYWETKKLGYKVKWYRGKITMGFDVISDNKTDWEKNMKRIGRAPYKFIMPIAISIAFVGWLLNSLGVTVAGVASIVMHIYTFSREGKTIE
jgi:hypothetical protein